MAQSQKRVIILNNASQVSDRPTYLTFCCNKISKNAEQLRNALFFHPSSWGAAWLREAMSVPTECRAMRVCSQELCWGAAWLREAKIQHASPKSKFFDLLISYLESFSHPKIGIQPFIYGLSRAFFTHEKKWNRDTNILSLADLQNVRSSHVLPPQNVTAPPHTFLLLSPECT